MSMRRTGSWLATCCGLWACGGPTDGSAGSATADRRFEERYVLTPDSVRLYARVVGHGPDTVIIPGGMYLAHDLSPLAEGRTLIFYDPRSRGGSDAVLDHARLGMEREVADLETVREHFGVERTDLIGWSYLGAVVALYAADHPGHVRSVVQLGPMGPRPVLVPPGVVRGSPPDSADVRYLAELERAGLPVTDPVRYCREWARIRMIRPMLGRPEAAARFTADPCIYWNEWPAQLFARMPQVIPQMAGVDWDYTERAARITAPVLTIHGTADPNAPVEGGRDWASLIPDARLLELDGVGHAAWLEAPDTFFTAVEAFLREHGRDR